MPVTVLDNNIFKIRNLRVEYDNNGPILTMNPGKAAACVICVSKKEPVCGENLNLSECDLESLINGAKLDFSEKGYTLQGVTRQQLAAAPQYRNFKMEPPAYVQVWGLGKNGNGVISLYLPESIHEQCVLVPVCYQVKMEKNGMYVWLQNLNGYEDGDLMYSIDGHLPIPIPLSALNSPIPLRPGAVPLVIPKPECSEKYLQK